MPRLLFFALLSMSLLSTNVFAQRLKSPEVNANGTITFRADFSDAQSVEVQFNRVAEDLAKVILEKNDAGKWEGTSKPMEPGIYEYTMQVDGIKQLDIRNRWVKKWYTLENLVEVPGQPPLVTERQPGPHGTRHLHVYHSPVTESLRDVVVYTPPGYSENPEGSYPVLFLLHGFGDDQTAWTEIGRAHAIADNLIASGKARPMLIVMPYGHPVELPHGNRTREQGSQYNVDNNRLMQRDLDEVLMPWVAKNYRVIDRLDARAIAGLSMGGGHSIRTALGTNDFAYVGAFSAAAPGVDALSEIAVDLDQFKKQTRLFWIACGNEDFLLQQNHRFIKQLEEESVDHQYVEGEGGHNWDVWRDDYLPTFLPMLFQGDVDSGK
ncbi:alpha/beta hydrolase-fold protein [Rhodopirellula sp. MGV]|uniref:alpha/beta hydrolase-fold protein n=1 Tax=Rhodopirellula sp. MGV TaxID=2023130 RepID=UPI00130421E5|nr:alpha/beta hydrolase-fold protein [Rhodopirellula sp. MGV]